MAPHIRTGVVASFVAAVALLAYSVGHGAAAAKPVRHTVTMEAVRFQPDVTEAKRGDSIVWVNKDPFPHTVTSQSGKFDSHQIQPGESWSYKVEKSGDIQYTCSLHPTMKATLRVK